MCVVGAVCWRCGPCPRSNRWTGYKPQRGTRSWPLIKEWMAQRKGGSFPWPHCSSDGSAIDVGEPTTVADAGVVVPATSIQTECIEMKSGSTRTQRGTKQGWEAHQDNSSHGGAMARLNRSSPKRRSKALNSRPMGRGGRGAHRGSREDVHSVREGSEGSSR